MNTRPSLKAILTMSVFILFICGAFLLNLIMPNPTLLHSERRKPDSFPKLSVKTILSAEFMDNFGKYASDNFIFRDTLRTMRAISVFDIFMQTDKSGLYYDSNVGAGKFEKEDEKSIQRTSEKLKYVCELLLDINSNINIYYSIIPDKNMYTAKYFPGFDFEKAHEILSGQLEQSNNIKYIDLKQALNGEEFYRTDIHWNQSNIYGVLDALSNAMGFSDRLDKNFTENNAGTFHGIYTGQLALPLKPDTMIYLTSDILNKAEVRYINPATAEWDLGVMYNIAAASGRDPYDMFLNGVQPLITIDNPSATTNRQLYIFRDSFGSSLAPLLTSAYSRITLIDLRYIDARALEYFITFAESDADVLFLYSSQILNNPNILLVTPTN